MHGGHAFDATFVTDEQALHLLHLAGGRSERAAAEIASRQLGNVTVWQLNRVGIGRGAIAHRLGCGRLHHQFRGVYLLGHDVPPPGALEVAAILSCDLRVVIGGVSAAALWGFAAPPEDGVHVLSGTHRRGCNGLHIHATTTLRREEITTVRGIPVTTALRTVYDLAAFGHPRLERAVSDAHAAGLITPEVLSAMIESHRGQPGVARLRPLAVDEARGFTRSENERRLRALCRQARLPQPVANARLCGWEVDFFWPAQRLVVEVDAYSTHGHRSQFERDRRKQADLTAAGYPVLRYTGSQLKHEPLAVIATLAPALFSNR